MFRRLSTWYKQLISNEQLQDRAELVEDVLYGAMSSADSEAVKATAELTTALCNNDCEAAVDAGSYVFFKVRNSEDKYQVFFKRLNVRDRNYLNHNPSAMKEPMKLLERFEEGRALGFERAAELRQISVDEKEKDSG